MYQAFLLDGITRIGEVTSFREVSAVESDLTHGNWIVRLNGDDLTANSLSQAIIDAEYLGLELVDNTTGWRYGGRATQLSRIYGEGGRIDGMEIKGEDFMGWLQSLILWPSGDLGEYWQNPEQTLQLSTLVTNTLYFQGGPGTIDPRRIIPNLNIIDADPAFGPTPPLQQSRIPLAEAWQPLFENTQWTYRLGLYREPGVNELRFTLGERPTANLLVTPSTERAVTITDRTASATFVVATGEEVDGGSPGQRYVAFAEGAENDWRTQRREVSVARPSTATDSLQSEVDNELARLGSDRTVTIPDFEIVGYGDIVNLGDFVTVSYDDDASPITVPVKSSTLKGTPAGWERTVSVGREILIGPRQLAEKYGDLARRLRRLESQL